MEINTKSHYNYHEVIIWLEDKGVAVYGNHFKILEYDHPIIFKLIAYFLKDEATCFQYHINPDKGIILSGPVGCGKTTLMNLMKLLAAPENKFAIKSCRDLSFEFIQDGYQVIHKYSCGKLNHSDPKALCFDDLGTESNFKYFGNECNVMAEILLSRYDCYISKRTKTHITTNLSASEIEKHYGIRVRSRLREMCNLIAFEQNTEDKRS